MLRWVAQWWGRLRIQHKVWAVLLLVCAPLVGGLAAHLYVVHQLLAVQQQRHALVLADNQVNVLRRLAVDIEDAFRGYVLTEQTTFLAPLTEAEAKLEHALRDARRSLAAVPHTGEGLASIEHRLNNLLRTKRDLIADIQRGERENALAYVRSGEGLRLSDRLRQDMRAIEDQIERQRAVLNDQAEGFSQQTFLGLWIALVGVLLLGWGGSRLLARSLTEPIMRLKAEAERLGAHPDAAKEDDGPVVPVLSSGDELGDLAGAYLSMARQIGSHIRELEVLNTIGHEINSIGPDGLDGVLRRITDRAVELVQADVCLVLVRDNRMGCWVVEAASGEWNDHLKSSVMLWEELPVSVQAFDTGEAAVGEHFHTDRRPQVVRRNLIGDSMLAIPLLSQGAPFGVLSLLSQKPRSTAEWNQRLAKGLAQEAALAISNARLFEAAQQKQKGLLARLRQLEYLAETLAHDLKGPGARMEELAKLLAKKFVGQVDERTALWLKLLQDNGADIVQRVEGILEVARVGIDQGAVTPVDSRAIIDDVLKARAGEIERLKAVVQVEPGFPLVACHRAYLRQLFDNLISNALKYAKPGAPPFVTLSARRGKHKVCFSVHDRGIGIPAGLREKVFHPFVRVGPAEIAGSGIGLAIVQRIVELYGGRVWIEGEEGDGCTVKFTLPWLPDGSGQANTGDCTVHTQETLNTSGSDVL